MKYQSLINEIVNEVRDQVRVRVNNQLWREIRARAWNQAGILPNRLLSLQDQVSRRVDSQVRSKVHDNL